MTALLAGILANPKLIAFTGAVLAIVGAWLRGRVAGAAAERNKQAMNDAASATEGQKIDDAVAGRSPGDNRGRLARWSKS